MHLLNIHENLLVVGGCDAVALEKLKNNALTLDEVRYYFDAYETGYFNPNYYYFVEPYSVLNQNHYYNWLIDNKICSNDSL